jgi:hypothetical protein
LILVLDLHGVNLRQVPTAPCLSFLIKKRNQHMEQMAHMMPCGTRHMVSTWKLNGLLSSSLVSCPHPVLTELSDKQHGPAPCRYFHCSKILAVTRVSTLSPSPSCHPRAAHDSCLQSFVSAHRARRSVGSPAVVGCMLVPFRSQHRPHPTNAQYGLNGLQASKPASPELLGVCPTPDGVGVMVLP